LQGFIKVIIAFITAPKNGIKQDIGQPKKDMVIDSVLCAKKLLNHERGSL
jgi:hypothetical protein